MEITLEVSEENESTRNAWWLIIDPKQMMSPDIYSVSSMITGPFFSRKEAQDFLDGTRYNFSCRATVFCHTGCYSDQYAKALEKF